jgi:hypothetical protein
MLRNVVCAVPYRDGGKVCHDMAECLGGCFGIPAVQGADDVGKKMDGACKSDDLTFGCATAIKDGKTAGTLCVD